MSVVIDGTLGLQVPASSTGNSGAVAWVNFLGTGSSGNATINASYNVASVLINSAGDFTITFTNALIDANYVVVGTSSGISTNNGIVCAFRNGSTGAYVAPTSSAFRINTSLTATNAASATNGGVMIAVFR